MVNQRLLHTKLDCTFDKLDIDSLNRSEVKEYLSNLIEINLQLPRTHDRVRFQKIKISLDKRCQFTGTITKTNSVYLLISCNQKIERVLKQKWKNIEIIRVTVNELDKLQKIGRRTFS